MILSIFKKSVGAKIALLTSGALFFVTCLVILIFHLLDVRLFSSFTLIHVVLTVVGLLIFVEVVLILLATNLFVQRPLQKLADIMKVAEQGNFLIRHHIDSPDEVGEISQSYNSMMEKIVDLEAQKIEADRKLIKVQESIKYKNTLEHNAKTIELTHKELENSLKDLSILYRTSEILGKTLELSELIHTLTKVLKETLFSKKFSLFLLDPRTSLLECVAAFGHENDEEVMQVKFKVGEGVCGQAVGEQRTIYIEDTSVEARYLHIKKNVYEKGAFISIPLIVTRNVLGVLNVNDLNIRGFNNTHIQFLESLANQIAIACDRAQLYMQTKELSVRDDLTGIFNRRYFQNVLRMELKRSLRFKRPLSLLMIDIDFFKQYNDTYGHLKGDKAIKQVSQLLVENLREVDTLARFGGEEFIALLVDTGLKDATFVGEKLRSLIEKNSSLFFEQLEDSSRIFSISIGVSEYPESASSEEELINTADIALYQGKAAGRNKVVAFEKPVSIETHRVIKGQNLR